MMSLARATFACLALAQLTEAAPTTTGPGCSTCDAGKALPCSVTNSYELLKKTQAFIQGAGTAEADKTATFETIATSSEYKIATGFYVFIYEFDGPCVSHGKNRNFEGKNLTEILQFINNPHVDGEYLHTNFVNAAKTGGDWVSYPWKNNANSPAYQKIAYEIKFTKWGKDYYAGVGYNEILYPPAMPCTTAYAADCGETNVMSIMGNVTTALRTAGSYANFQKVFQEISDKTSYRLDTGFYVFAYEFDGKCVAHGGNPTFVGKSLSGILSSVGNTFVDGVALHMQFVAAANEDGGWVAYPWKNTNAEGIYSKVAYIMKVSMNNKHYYFGVGYNNICGASPLTSCAEDARQSCLPMEALPYQHKAGCETCTISHAHTCAIQNTVSLLSRVQGDSLMTFGDITNGEDFEDDTGFYVFIYEFAGPCVAHGANGAFVGKKLQEILDMVGNTYTQGDPLHDDFVKAATQGGGWVGYKWRNKNSDTITNKMSYIIKLIKNGKPYYAGVGFNGDAVPAVTDCTPTKAKPCAEANTLSVIGKAMVDMYAQMNDPTAFNQIFKDIDDQSTAVSKKLRIEPGFYIFAYDFDGPCVAHGANSKHVGKTLPQILTSVGNTFVDGDKLHQDFVAAAKKGGGWVNYEWRSNSNDPFFHKSAFIMQINAHGKYYYVGSGYNNVCPTDEVVEMQVCGNSPSKCGAEANTQFKFLRVGGPMQRTGKWSAYGRGAITAFEVWRDWVNSQSDLPYSVELDFRDDQSMSNNAVSIANQMLTGEKPLDILVSPYGDGASEKIVEAVNSRVPVLVWGGASESIFATGKSKVFGTLTPAGQYMTMGLDALYDAGAKKVLFVKNFNSFSTSVCDGAIDHARSKGYTIVNSGQAVQVANDATDVTSKLMALDATSKAVDVVVGCGHIQDVKALFIESEKHLTYKAMLATEVSTDNFLDQIKDENYTGCGLLMPTQWTSEGSGKDDTVGWTSKDFSTAYRQLSGATPSSQAASAAASAVALSNAIKAAGTAMDMNKVVTQMHALDTNSFYGRLKFDATGMMIGKPVYIVQNQRHGEPKMVAPSSMATASLAYPDTCPAAAVSTTTTEEETPAWVIPVIIACGVVVLLLLVIVCVMMKRVMDLYKCIADLKAAGVTVQRPSFKDTLAVATGRTSGKELSKRISAAAQL